MINFSESEITQILPENFRASPEIKAISYAIGQQITKLTQYSSMIRVYAAIDSLPENILDLLAVEFRSQYYDETFDIATKRNLLKKTLIWYERAGTPSAVRELVEIAFGTGEISEWFEYNGSPYRFRIKTSAIITEDIVQQFEKIISKVKNTRSHLESVEIERQVFQTIYAGSEQKSFSRTERIDDVFEAEYNTASTVFAGTAEKSLRKEKVTDVFSDTAQAALTIRFGGATKGFTRQTIRTED